MTQKLYEQVHDYFVSYIKSKREGPTNDSLFSLRFGPALVTHVLIDQGHKGPVGDVGAAIRHAFGGKSVFEVGCRYGGIIKFLEDHGARVGGNTDAERVSRVRGRLKKGAVVLQAKAEELSGSRELAEFNPHIVLSGGLFSGMRTTLNTKAAVGAFTEMLRRGASVYMLPSAFKETLLTKEHWGEFRKAADVSGNTFVRHERASQTFSMRPKRVRK